MKDYYCYRISLLLGLMVLACSLQAQRFVPIASSADPVTPTDVFSFIMGDTTETGDRVDNNTIYQLENGQVYVTSGRLTNTATWPLQIEAADLTDTENKAILSRLPNASGEFPDIMRASGDVSLKNVWIISGEKGALEQHDWGKIRMQGYGSKVVVKDCIIEKDRGGFIQIRADSIRCYVDNSILRNGGNRRIIQGNGRGIDARNFFFDTLVVRNSVVHNIQDRFFRSQGGTKPHNYIEFDQNTSFNTVGRHGHIQLGKVLTAKITNNIFMNPILLGSSPVYTDEQTQPDGDLHKVITVDTLYDGTSLTIASNNIFWTQDVLDYWASNDSVNVPGILSDLVKENMGADTTGAYFSEVLSLENVPVSILQYVKDLYADPASLEMFDFIVEDVLVEGTPFDSGNLFDLSEFSPCYDNTSASATASTDGSAVGAVAGCDNIVSSLFKSINNPQLGLTISPNPIGGQEATLSFDLTRAGYVQLNIFDLSGRLTTKLIDGNVQPGTQVTTWRPSAQLSRGLYFAQLNTVEGSMTVKLMLQ